ncbi:hypothetical protein F0562_034382 [Nyssa sinensis]|uniref:Disease resistance R13L4/SHOC-2-like LRR domain-containing protein n=1 Tax=Nyssa sinensis TaxID=561372 RepID=A0A5J5AI09_9ASTE|nr:hypothetical protein F0562_034382 [Nyssa sinensis]
MKLFYEMVVESPVTDLSHELRDLGDQIVERCGGVPLSIVVTVELLILERKHLGDLGFLRVLCVECKELPLSLPDEIGNLSQLSYLRLWAFGLRKLPSMMSNLKTLLTLDAEECYNLLFDDVIWKMKQLRHIIFPRVRVSESASHILLFRDKITRCKANMHRFCSFETCLPNPQTLLHMHGFNLKFHWLRKFTNLRKLGINFSTERIFEVLSGANPAAYKLEYLQLFWLINFFETTKLNLFHYQNLFKLKLSGGIKQFPGLDKLPTNLTKLTLVQSELKEDAIEILKKLPKLKVLKLGSWSYKEREIVCFGAENFPHLEVLKLQYLYKLEKLLVEEGGMPKLNKLQIHRCEPLREISDWLKNKM